MGFFDKLFGGKPAAGGWFTETLEPDQAYPRARDFLDKVAAQARLQAPEVTRPEPSRIELRGTLEGFPLRVIIDHTGDVHTVNLRYEGGFDPIDLDHDPAKADAPPPAAPWDPTDQVVMLGAGVSVRGSNAAREAAAFRQLPAPLQQRVTDELRRLRIRYFRSRRSEHDVALYDSARQVADPVKWLADTLALAVEVARARGARPVDPRMVGASKEERRQLAWAAALELAGQLAARQPGARVVERQNDGCIDIRWSQDGTPVRLVFEVGSREVDASARASGVTGSFELYQDREVVIEAEPEHQDPWDEVEQKLFFGRSIYLEGSKSEVAAEAALLRALPAERIEELTRTMTEHDIRGVSLDDEVVELMVCALGQITDGGVKALAVAGVLARVAAALPRGAAPRPDVAAVRCAYCRALWFPSPGRAACVNCGATA